jgi:beta-1,4-mannosyltransferase
MARRTTLIERARLHRRSPGEAQRSSPADARSSEPVLVLQSGGPPHARRNPYITQLLASLPESAVPLYFSWRRALVGRYDVLHVHWPDAALGGRTPLRAAVRSALWALVLLRLRWQRRALVRTLHDVEPYEPASWPQRWLLPLFDRWTTMWITLTEHTAPPRPAPVALVRHGHYRDWYADAPREDRIRGRLLHFGLLRRYKGTEALLGVFAQLPDERVTLRIVGYPRDDGVAAAVERARRDDPRVTARLEYVSDAELAREVSRSQLVVLPFDRVTNSGSLILALSLGRPVLVPATPITEEIADEVGSDWVLTYDPPLDPGALTRALAATEAPQHESPDLSRRDWPAIGNEHAAAFARARDIARRRTRWSRHVGSRGSSS